MQETKKILIPLPSYGFDPTETAIPWKILTKNGIKITFSTPNGFSARGDEIMLTGKKLGIFKNLLNPKNSRKKNKIGRKSHIFTVLTKNINF